MKYFRILLAITLAASFSSCRKLAEFHIEESATFSIPATAGFLPLEIFSPETRTNFEESFKLNDSKIKWAEEASLDHLELNILSPSGEDFSFMKSVEVYLSAPNEPEKLLAYLHDIPSSPGRTLTLVATKVSLREFLDEDYVTMRTVTDTDEAISNRIEVRADYRIFVRAKTSPF